MPRPRQPKNEQNPLLLLRKILAEAEAPLRITQEQFANLIQRPLDQIKNVEAGRRPLSARLQHSIALWTGAIWDKENGRWVFGSRKLVPFTAEIYRQYKKTVRGPLQCAELDRKILQRKIDALFEEALERDHYPLLLRLSALLEQCRAEFGLTALAQFFEETEPIFSVIYDSKTGKLLEVYQDIASSALAYVQPTKEPGDLSATIEDVVITTKPAPLPSFRRPKPEEREQFIKSVNEWLAAHNHAQLAREKGTTAREPALGRKTQKARATSGRTARL